MGTFNFLFLLCLLLVNFKKNLNTSWLPDVLPEKEFPDDDVFHEEEFLDEEFPEEEFPEDA